MPRTISVEIVGDASSLERSFRKASADATKFGRNVEKAGRGALVASVGFHGLGRMVGYASASFLGGAGFVAAAKAGFDELFAGQKVAAQTAAALKSTGGIAGVSAHQISTLAGTMQKLTGYDDEAIQSAENLLLTFTNVRNVAGKNNDIFNQATEATLNLSRTFDQDLGASAVQLGKALQDPVRGVTALRRVGVSFSAAQQNMIKRLVASGDVLKAQKIILHELTVETGNSARAYGKTLPGQLDILRGNLENLGGELAKTLNPELKKLVDRFNKWLEDPENKQKVIDTFTNAINEMARAAKAAADAIGLFKKIWDALPHIKGRPATPSLEDLIKQIYGFHPGKPIYPGAPVYGPSKPKPGRPGGAAPPGAGAGAGPRGVTATQRNAWFDALIERQLGRVQDISSIRGQIARLGQIAQLIRDRMAVTKDITRRLTLEDKLLDVLRQQRQDRDTLRQQAQDAAKKAAEQAAKNVKAAADRIQKVNDAAIAQAKAIESRAAAMRRAAQFKALGLTATGQQRTTIKWLRRRAAQVAKKIGGSSADTAANRARLARIHYVLTTWNQLDPAVAEEIRKELDDIAGEAGGGDTMPASLFQHVPAARLAGMLGLGGSRAARGILAQYGAGGSLPRGNMAFSGGVVIGTVHVHGVHNVKQLQNEMQKLQRGQPSNRRGAR